jgi:hypothetical protein
VWRGWRPGHRDPQVHGLPPAPVGGSQSLTRVHRAHRLGQPPGSKRGGPARAREMSMVSGDSRSEPHAQDGRAP